MFGISLGSGRRKKLFERQIGQHAKLNRRTRVRNYCFPHKFGSQTLASLGFQGLAFLDLFHRLQCHFKIPGKSTDSETPIDEFIDGFLQSAELIENTDIFFNYKGARKPHVEIRYFTPEEARRVTLEEIVSATPENILSDLITTLLELKNKRASLGKSSGIEDPTENDPFAKILTCPYTIERFGCFVTAEFGESMGRWGRWESETHRSFLETSPRELAHHIRRRKIESLIALS